MGEGEKTARQRSFCWWCVGLFPVVSFPTLASLLISESDAIVALPSSTASFIRAAAFIALALCARRVVSVLDKPRALAGCALVMTLGIAGELFVPAGSLPGTVLLVAAMVAANAGYAMLYLAWMELYSQMSAQYVLVYFASTHLLSALLSYVVFAVDSSLATAVVALVIPLSSVALLRQADVRTRDALCRQGEAQHLDWRLSLRPIAMLAAFSFANTVARSLLKTASDQAFVLLGVAVVAVCVLVFALLPNSSLDSKPLYQVSVPLLVAGMLLVLVDAAWAATAAAFLTNAAFTLFSVFATVLFCGAAYRYGVNALWLFGVVQGSLVAGSAIGRQSATWLAPLLSDQVFFTIVVGALVVVVTALAMALVSDRDFSATWGLAQRPGGDDASAAVDEEEALAETCRRVAQRYGLTRREEEVLVLMMRGHTLPRIGEELYVAESTMKTHSRHIYRKVGVSNRKELQEFVESYPGKRR